MSTNDNLQTQPTPTKGDRTTAPRTPAERRGWKIRPQGPSRGAEAIDARSRKLRGPDERVPRADKPKLKPISALLNEYGGRRPGNQPNQQAGQGRQGRRRQSIEDTFIDPTVKPHSPSADRRAAAEAKISLINKPASPAAAHYKPPVFQLPDVKAYDKGANQRERQLEGGIINWHQNRRSKFDRPRNSQGRNFNINHVLAELRGRDGFPLDSDGYGSISQDVLDANAAIANAKIDAPPDPETGLDDFNDQGCCFGHCVCCDEAYDAMMATSLCEWCVDNFGNVQEKAAIDEMTNGVIVPFHAQKTNQAVLEHELRQYPPKAVLSVTIRRSDLLQPDVHLTHPMVRMYLVDLISGEHWLKPDVNVSAVHNYENNIKYVLPMMTKPFLLRQSRAFVPAWHEQLLLNVPLTNVLTYNAMLLFEILDFGPRVNPDKYKGGLYPVCWGFLKLQSSKGTPNLGRNLRLQLYRFSHSERLVDKPNVPDVYFEWIWQKHVGFTKYPSTLWCEVHGVPPVLDTVLKGVRGLHVGQHEEGRLTYDELKPKQSNALGLDTHGAHDRKQLGQAQQSENARIQSALEDPTTRRNQREALIRYRKKGELCKLPDQFLNEITVGRGGSYCMDYSPNGEYLAVACSELVNFPIKLFEANSTSMLVSYDGHQQGHLVYDLSFSADSNYLVSASSDKTARIWFTREDAESHRYRPTPVQSLQHTCFVYTARFHPTDPELVFTGGYDGLIRVWKVDLTGQQDPIVMVALANHDAHVNAIVFSPTGTRFFSGDASGVIKVWSDRSKSERTAHVDPERAKARQALKQATAQARAASAVFGDKFDSLIAKPTDDQEDFWAEGDYSTRFKVIRKMAFPELKGEEIMCLCYHHRPERLVAYTKSSGLFMFRLLRYELRHTFTGHDCGGKFAHCEISPDGHYLVAGSIDGRAYFWTLADGRLRYKLDVGFRAPIVDVAWHPNQHLVAFSSFTADAPIITWKYEHQDRRKKIERRMGQPKTLNQLSQIFGTQQLE